MVQIDEDFGPSAKYPRHSQQELPGEHHAIYSAGLLEGSGESLLLLLHEDRPADREEVGQQRADEDLQAVRGHHLNLHTVSHRQLQRQE